LTRRVGYRPFDIAACQRAFPDFCYMPDGLGRLHMQGPT
jgi:hypothetical protein